MNVQKEKVRVNEQKWDTIEEEKGSKNQHAREVSKLEHSSASTRDEARKEGNKQGEARKQRKGRMRGRARTNEHR